MSEQKQFNVVFTCGTLGDSHEGALQTALAQLESGDAYVEIFQEGGECVEKDNFHDALAAMKRADLETPKMLVLSTGHVTKETNDRFTNGEAGVTFYPKAYPDGELVGFILPLVKGYPWDRENVPAELHAIRAMAEEAGCTWIMFDRDGEIVEALPSYDW